MKKMKIKRHTKRRKSKALSSRQLRKVRGAAGNFMQEYSAKHLMMTEGLSYDQAIALVRRGDPNYFGKAPTN